MTHSCICCESPTTLPGLCELCVAFASLRRAFGEGDARRAGYEPLLEFEDRGDAPHE